MAKKKKEGLPTDWQSQVKEVIDGHSEKSLGDPWGLILPETWRAELMKFVRDGQVGRLMGVRRIQFSGDTVGIMAPPLES